MSPAMDQTTDDEVLNPLVRLFTPEQGHRLEGLIICRDHVPQIVVAEDPPFIMEHFTAEQVAFWNHRCLMCSVEAVPDRMCENEDCRRPLHPQWPALYCCNGCALEDA